MFLTGKQEVDGKTMKGNNETACRVITMITKRSKSVKGEYSKKKKKNKRRLSPGTLRVNPDSSWICDAQNCELSNVYCVTSLEWWQLVP